MIKIINKIQRLYFLNILVSDFFSHGRIYW